MVKPASIILLILLLAGATATATAGENGELVDVSGLIREVRDQRAPRLGIELLRSGGTGRLFDESEESRAGPIPIEDLAQFVDCGVGLDGAASGFGRNLLLLQPEQAPFSRACLRSFAADLSRTVRLEVTATRADGREYRGEIRVRPGRWGSLAQIRSHFFVYDFDVELACDDSGGFFPCVVGDPVVGAALTGFAVEARPFLVDGGRTIALEVHLQLEHLAGVDTMLTGARYLGAIELPGSRTTTALISGAVAPGEALVTRIQSADGALVIRLVPHLEGVAATDRLRLLEAGLAVLGPARARLAEDYESSTSRVWDQEAATELILAGAPLQDLTDVEEIITPTSEGRTGFIWPIGGGDLVAAGSLAFHEAARKKLDRVLAPLARTVRLDFAVRAGEQLIGRATLSALAGRTAFLRLGTDRNMIRDHDVEVGCYVQIADPIVLPVFSGWLIHATPRIAPDGKTITLALKTRLQGMGARPVRRELGEEVCGSLQVIAMPSREIGSDLVLTAGDTVRLAAGRWIDGRPLVLEVTSLRPPTSGQ